MSAITRGVVGAVLLAGAVAGAAAFPHLLAGPGGGETVPVAPLPAAAQPAIVHAATATERGHIPVRAVVTPAVIARVSVVPIARPAAAKLKPIVIHPIVIHRVAPAPRIAPEPAPAPASVTASAPAPPPTSTPAAIPAAAVAPPNTPAPAPAQPAQSHGEGKAKGRLKKEERQVAAVEQLPSTNDGPPTQQAPPGTGGDNTGPVQPVEAPDAQAAPPDHGHGPPPWSHGGGKGH
jgi:hypothetical protein